MSRRFALDLIHGRAVAVAIAGDDGEGNLPEEVAAAAHLGPARRREYLAGRRALRAALADLGVTAPAIGADPRGAPIVPAPMVGSISHKGELALAVAAPADGWTVGVDLERRAPRTIDLSRRVLTDRELAALADRDDDARRRAVVQAFAIKEAIYKAIDPFLGRYVGFREVAVWPEGDRVEVEAPAAWGLEVVAACAEVDDHWVATARARRR
ncbi:MAG: 4'-phosphopantetheinyl transferase superfamily protein [Kofleriaceae bacterium]|nr:4'-phosphopantetheinyl transferase superfamily protein [Kofleriaceae bacterium]MBP9170516.1 4'-phosphopantetheinyl transferase superfamily protein [Kofleriaceae bacterium]MBP9860849.1 4'-phosphopantetheinyl transferase superfamily protein [Kofleriaceae bacterium]